MKIEIPKDWFLGRAQQEEGREVGAGQKIKVTKDHIKNGIKCDPQNCPIGLALKDAGIPFTHIGHLWISQYGPLFYKNNDKVKDFINDFDEYKIVKPFSFILPEPNTNLPLNLGKELKQLESLYRKARGFYDQSDSDNPNQIKLLEVLKEGLETLHQNNIIVGNDYQTEREYFGLHKIYIEV